MKDEDIRAAIGRFSQDPEFAVRIANLGKDPEKHVTIAEWPKVALSLPRFYAVVEAAEMAIAVDLCVTLGTALEFIAQGNDRRINEIANRAARLAWQSQQPLIGQDRLSRSVMGFTSGNLPDEELVKDIERVRATAKFLLEELGIE